MHKYIVMVDENDQPYISHALLSNFRNVDSKSRSTSKNVGAGMGRGYRVNHKYLQKIGEGNNAKYFYTQEQLRAYMNGGRRKATKTADTVKQNSFNKNKNRRDALLSTPSKLKGNSKKNNDVLSRNSSKTIKDIIELKNKSKKKESASTKSEFGEYKKNDSDFDEKNYSNKNHITGSDYYAFIRSDGRQVILEEDHKWVLPKGITINSPGIRSALKNFEDSEATAKALGKTDYSYDDRAKAISDAIDNAIENASRSGSISRAMIVSKKK